MCGRITLVAAAPDVAERFDVDVETSLSPRYNVAPRDPLVAITDESPGTTTTLTWGLRTREGGDRRINARAETVRETPAFREAFAERRCLVVVDGFYEWGGPRDAARPYHVGRTDGDPFALAGIWNPDGSCAVLTRPAGAVVAPVHDREPLVLPPGADRSYLEAGPAVLDHVCEPAPAADLSAHEVSTRVNDPSNDGPGLIEPVGSEQAGLDEFSG